MKLTPFFFLKTRYKNVSGTWSKRNFNVFNEIITVDYGLQKTEDFLW